MNLIFTEQPGELYDLLDALSSYFSHKNYETQKVIENINQCLGNVDDHIALFFEKREDQAVFMLHEIFPALLAKAGPLAGKEELNQFLEAGFLKERLFHFYIGKPMPAELTKAASQIANHELPMRLKYQLLSFCTDAQQGIRCLKSELERIGHAMEEYRFYCKKELESCQKQIGRQSSKTLMRSLSNIGGRMVRWNEKEDLYISFCVLNRHVVERQTIRPLVILGLDYQETLKELRGSSIYDIFEIMKALGNPLRGRIVHILQMANNHVPLSVLSTELGETSHVTKYQLSVLTKSGLVKVKEHKKELCYIINKECCEYALRNIPRLFNCGMELSIEEKRRGIDCLYHNK